MSAVDKIHEVPSRGEERAEALRLYQETTLTVEQIGEMFGVTRQSVDNWIKKSGIPRRGPMGPRRKYPDLEEAKASVEALADLDPLVRIETKLDRLAVAVAHLQGALDAHARLLGSFVTSQGDRKNQR